MTETILGRLENLFVMFEILNLGYWDLFVICDLGFGIFMKSLFSKNSTGLLF